MNPVAINQMGIKMLQPLDTDRLLHETEAANLLSLKVSTLRRWRWAGQGPCYIKLGAAVRYDPQVLKDYLAKSVRTSTSDPGEQAV